MSVKNQIPLLWMDDEPQFIENYKQLLIIEGKQLFEIQVATSINEANNFLESKTNYYSGLIVDCKMDPFDALENGARFLSDINKKIKHLPTYVYSAYTTDPQYKSYIDNSLAIITEQKEINFQKPLLSQRFFKTILEKSGKYNKVKNIYPELITFHDYITNTSFYSKAVESHWEKHGHWIDIELTKKNWLWCVVIGENLYKGSSDLLEFPNEKELVQIGDRTNLIPFAYSKLLLPEDTFYDPNVLTQWNRTNLDNDFYPTIVAKINDRIIKDDFDTGAYCSFITSNLVEPSIFDFICSNEYGIHLGRDYKYFTKKVTISLIDDFEKEIQKELTIIVVKDWESSTFIQNNKNRQVLYGRDLLRTFAIEIYINSMDRITKIKLL